MTADGNKDEYRTTGYNRVARPASKRLQGEALNRSMPVHACLKNN